MLGLWGCEIMTLWVAGIELKAKGMPNLAVPIVARAADDSNVRTVVVWREPWQGVDQVRVGFETADSSVDLGRWWSRRRVTPLHAGSPHSLMRNTRKAGRCSTVSCTRMRCVAANSTACCSPSHTSAPACRRAFATSLPSGCLRSPLMRLCLRACPSRMASRFSSRARNRWQTSTNACSSAAAPQCVIVHAFCIAKS